MVAPILVFLFVTGFVLVLFALGKRRADASAGRKLRERLQEKREEGDAAGSAMAVVKRQADGMVPAVDRLFARTRAGSWLARLIEQSGVSTTPGAIVLASVALGGGCAVAGGLIARTWLAMPVAAALGGAAPFVWLNRQRSARIRRFEEQFPEVLELLSRALRAGHAFQTALGMAATELKQPASGEFKKTFDEQNFGLPLRDALMGLADRMPLLDVRFFVTAVLIQRESGGNLAEILDNLAAVVRERFKIQRQVRIHAAHGRFTGFVLLGLPVFLALALSLINPDHMALLFRERMGQMMLGGAMLLQGIGYVWIRQVIKIEV